MRNKHPEYPGRSKRKKHPVRYKVLPLPFTFERLVPDWPMCVNDWDRIAPVFGRPGFYFARGSGRTWIEFAVEGDLRAYLYGSPDQFRYDLMHSDGNNLLDEAVYRALGLLVKRRLVDQRLKDLYYAQRDMRLLRAHARLAAKSALGFRNRFRAFKAKVEERKHETTVSIPAHGIDPRAGGHGPDRRPGRPLGDVPIG